VPLMASRRRCSAVNEMRVRRWALSLDGTPPGRNRPRSGYGQRSPLVSSTRSQAQNAPNHEQRTLFFSNSMEYFGEGKGPSENVLGRGGAERRVGSSNANPELNSPRKWPNSGPDNP
jgi:hypothetical protein